MYTMGFVWVWSIMVLDWRWIPTYIVILYTFDIEEPTSSQNALIKLLQHYYLPFLFFNFLL